MMKFYNREQELEALNKTYSRKGSDFLVISGRRRIGKSRLIEEFVKDKKAVNLFIVPKEKKQVVADLEAEVRLKFGYSPAFTSLREAFAYLFEQNVGLVCLDEFSNILVVNEAVPFELQRLWDKYRDSKDIMLVVSGSYAGMMNRLFAAKKAPLFNRATLTLNLSQFSFGTVSQIFEQLSCFVARRASKFLLCSGRYSLLLRSFGEA